MDLCVSLVFLRLHWQLQHLTRIMPLRLHILRMMAYASRPPGIRRYEPCTVLPESASHPPSLFVSHDNVWSMSASSLYMYRSHRSSCCWETTPSAHPQVTDEITF